MLDDNEQNGVVTIFKILLFLFLFCLPVLSPGQEKEYKIWQFLKENIPVIDGDGSDWESAPESYVITIDEMRENNYIGLGWAVIDYDANPESKDGFWNLSKEHTMYGNASFLPKMKLMPLSK